MFTYNYANSILNSLCDNAYLGLSTTTPSQDGTGVTEPTDSAYKRISIDNMMASAANGEITNAEELHFNASTAAWGSTVTHVCVYDSKTGGTPKAYGALTTPLSITAGNIVPTIKVGDITITID